MRSLLALFALAPLALSAACGARTSLPGDDRGGGGDSGRPALCGDGLTDDGEACDDGNDDDTDACKRDCTLGVCGDGVVSRFEACDDGNTQDGDGCEADCSFSTCGDGVVQPNEACDSPDPDLCTPLCLLPACGDGFVAPASEACDDGAANEDRPAITLIDGATLTRVVPILGPQHPADFYAYSSASAHTGFEALHTSNLFLYQQGGQPGLSLFTIHGIDLDSSGQAEGDVVVNQTFSGLPGSTFVTLADDKDSEFGLDGPGGAFGAWDFHDNTDGGVLTAIPFPGDWAITVDSELGASIVAWLYQDQATGARTLAGASVTLVAASTASHCRTDCTAPRCGDLLLDGGEVCDDGNTSSGDGCAGDCRSTE